MKKLTVFSLSTFILLWAIILIGTGCSKGSDSPANNNTNNNTDTSGYYLSASVNGQAWNANMNTTLDNSPAIGIIVTGNGTSIMVFIGFKAANKDSSAFALIFPENISLNQAHAFDSSKYIDGLYISEASPGSSNYNDYSSSKTYGGSGTITVATFDKTNSIVSGTFSGTFGAQNGGAALQITNGKFRCPYTTNTNLVPVTGIKIKM